MSKTIIYKIGQNKLSRTYREIDNAWRGAMCLWRYLEDKYLPLYRPEYSKAIRWYREDMSDEEFVSLCGYRPTRISDLNHPEKFQEIIDLLDDRQLSPADKICLYTTCDRVIVKREYLPTVIWAFENVGCEGSFREQADILKELYEDTDCFGTAWCQTDCGDSYFGEYDGENYETAYYNIEENKLGKEIYYMFEDEELPDLLGIEKGNNC